MPPDVAAELRRALTEREVAQRVGEVIGHQTGADGTVTLELTTGGESLVVYRTVLATGFEPRQSGGEAGHELAVEERGLPCAACGYPVLGGTLAWQEGIFVSAPLAEVELGPVARNIGGARLTAERLGRWR